MTDFEGRTTVEEKRASVIREAREPHDGPVLDDGDENIPDLPKWKFAFILVALCLTVLCMALDNTILAPAIPRISDTFHSLEDIGWYGSSYLLTVCAFPLVYGKLYTFYALKWVFLSAIALFEIGSAICGAAPNSVALIVGRAIAGIGAAGIFSGAVLIISAMVPLRKRPVYIGLVAAMYGIAGVAGPLLGGAFTDSAKLTWRWCFYINLPIGAIAIACIVFFLQLPANHTNKGLKQLFREIDIPGTTVFIPGVVCLLLALQWGGSKYAWHSGRIIALLVVFALLIIAFVVIQVFSGERATVPPRIFRNRNVWGSALFGFSVGAAFFVIVFYLPIWFQAIKGVSAVKSAIMNLPLILSMTITIILSGAAVSIQGYYGPFLYASAVLMSIGAGLLSTFSTHTGHAAWIGYQVIFGVGVGTGMQQTPIIIQTCLSPPDVPVGTAVILFAQMFGGALTVAISQNIFTSSLVARIAPLLPPGVDPRFVLGIGATELRRSPLIPPEILPQVLEAYNYALTRGFYVSVATGALAVLGAAAIEWRSVKEGQVAMDRRKKQEKLEQDEREAVV